MNERIEKLARECFDVANDGNGDEYLGTTAGIEKFAELIVRQSAKVGSHYGGNVKHLILHYFGVEP
mgnify:CR=1 FL=1